MTVRLSGVPFLIFMENMKRETIEGIIQGNERGYGFLIPNDKTKEDYFIPHGDLRGAMHRDEVLCEVTSKGGERTTARVLKVVKRGLTEVVGTYFSSRSGGFVCPDDKKYFCDIFIPFGRGVKAKSGDKVVCKILAYPKGKNPEGLISQIIGRQFTKEAELKSIILAYNLADEFPKEVVCEANAFKGDITKEELKGRSDFRNKLTITIDGDDSRDFDDAVSIDKLQDGKFLLGVHIADVSHYVLPFKAIDKEAFNRATSVYFPESVIPMLPERLSNDLCSLKEGVDRLTLSCVMTIDQSGKVLDSKISPSVIKSSARMTYSNVQKILDGDEKLCKKYSFLIDTLYTMNELTDLLIKRREEEGSINLDVKESAIYVDKSGNLEVVSAPRDRAHRIIEEFMILANRAVAEFMFYLENPFIYRVHDLPDEEKLENFYAFVGTLGVNVKRRKGEVFSKDYQKILSLAEGKPAYTLINRVMLRSMKKAKYSPEDIGHFGLSAEHYCHFTSPIRRYPDLVIHRIIKDFLRGETDLTKRYGEFVYKASEQSSLKEKNAEEAERAVDDYYKMLYISNFEGEEFNGVVSGVTKFGIFVELDNGIEGLVKIENLPGRRYALDEKNYTLSDGKRSFKLGNSVKIMVAGVNLAERRAEFLLIEGQPIAKNKKK